ncbi:DNA methyltransferase [Williamsia sp. 1135]|uniref:Eco57I restriction-modification methylase domain-containing protein n=1 Tax=Williamsia sp. 1135 TaxID=1889262 RepID=UPI001F0AC7BE|nr:DNA methyltransferase [Williamsia sp. 1135]
MVGGGLDVAPGLGETSPPHFPISHRLTWPNSTQFAVWVPLHLLGAGVPLDGRTEGVTARAPQSMVQDYLNREDRALWALLSNGRTLRLLRDASTLAKQSYVEFDLDDIFTNQRYADFRLLFLTAHASRFAPRAESTEPVESDTESADSGLKPEDCWLETWRTTAIEDGARALLTLQQGVATALQHLGTGFVSHPANTALRDTLAHAQDADRDLHRALLRIAYRLIVLFVAEDRDLLHTLATESDARTLYTVHFSTARLRRMASTRGGSRHTDLWEAHQIVTDAVAGEGQPVLGLNGLGATLFARENLSVLDGAKLPNSSFLAAIKALAEIDDPATGIPRPVDYRNLDSEELGGMYEGLLAFTPRYDAAARTFTLEIAAGNDRKKSGSYYTPSDLIALVLDEVLNPLIDEAMRAPDPEAALLALTVVDPAVGSGHFVVAAARRLAAAVATVRTGDTEPNPIDLRAATADVIERCIYGVDLNDLAIEITKVALWLEAFDANRPFPFLDAHFKVGNALLGTTPELLRHNIPDSAFTVLGDDDKTWTSKLKARNKAERAAIDAQLTFSFGHETLNVETMKFTKAAREADTGRAADLRRIRARADAWRTLEADPEMVAAKLVGDAWCAAFVQSKTKTVGPQPENFESSGQGITHNTVRQFVDNVDAVPPAITESVRQLARQYRFFHWHLEFPGIFTVPNDGAAADPITGWTGGFSCVVGNPPWERVKIQDKEFFANIGRNDIADSKTAAIRKKMIETLAEIDPDLYTSYCDALRQSDGTSHLLLKSGRYPLTGKGDVNTYSVFAETMRTIAAPNGIAGIITPTGLGTDKTTAPFFSDTLSNKRLLAFYDFENEAKIFAEVHHSFRFAITAMAGRQRAAARSRFAFLTRHLADVPSRRFELAPDEVLAMNPNTGTLPMFRTRADADITLGIYRRHPVLIHDNAPDGNPWGLSFARLFDMANDSGLFRQPEDLAAAEFNGWSYDENGQEYVPLYEAKMLGHFDHRFSTYRDATQAQLNVGSLPRPTDEQHGDPYLEVQARYWIERPKVAKFLRGKWDRGWLLGWRDIARASDSRTMTPAVLPYTAVAGGFPLAFPRCGSDAALLQSVWSSLPFDFVVRQKNAGTHLNMTLMRQFACPTPSTFAGPTGWQSGCTLATWVLPYALELSYTSWRLQPYARELGDHGAPFKWNSERRTLLRADLDAAFMHVYGLTRSETEHVLDSFPVVRKYEERVCGHYRTRALVLEAYDRLAAAIARGGTGWESLAGAPAGQGPRHSIKRALP